MLQGKLEDKEDGWLSCGSVGLLQVVTIDTSYVHGKILLLDSYIATHKEKLMQGGSTSCYFVRGLCKSQW